MQKNNYNLEEQIDEFLSFLAPYISIKLKIIYRECIGLLIAISFGIYFQLCSQHIITIIFSWSLALFILYWIIVELIHNIIMRKLRNQLNNDSLKHDLRDIKFCKKLLSKLRWISLPYFFLNDLRLRRWLKMIIKNLEKNKVNK